MFPEAPKKKGMRYCRWKRTQAGPGGCCCERKRKVRARYVNIFYNDEDIRFLKDLDTPVSENDRISIVPAIAGGA